MWAHSRSIDAVSLGNGGRDFTEEKRGVLPKEMRRVDFDFVGTKVPNSQAWGTVSLC